MPKFAPSRFPAGSIPGRRNNSFCLIEGTTLKTESWDVGHFSFFRFLKFSFRVSFFSLSFLFAAVIGLLLGLLAVKKLLRKLHRDGKFLPWSSSELLNQLFEHFCAYLRLHQADHSDLGIIGKIFSSCRSWLYMMIILVMTSEVECRK